MYCLRLCCSTQAKFLLSSSAFKQNLFHLFSLKIIFENFQRVFSLTGGSENFMESHTKFSSIKKSYHLFWKVSSTMWTKHSIIWKILSLTSRAYSLHGRVSNLVWKLSCSIWEVSILIRKWNKRFEVLRMCGNRRECEFYPSSWRSRTTVATQAPVTGKCFEGFCILSVYVYQIMLTTRCQSPAPLTETEFPADDSFLDMAV